MSLEAAIAEIVEHAVRRAVAEALAERDEAPIVLTVDEATKALRVSRRKVEQWVADGVLPRLPHTKRLLIPRVAIEAFVTDTRGEA